MTTLKAALFGACILASAIGGAFFWDAVEGEPKPPTPVTVTMERPAQEADLPDEAATPDTRREYEAPDSGGTFTNCFRLPSAIFDSTAARPTASESPTASRQPEIGSSDTSKTTGLARITSSPQSAVGPDYGIIPMTQGRPKLSVGSSRVQVPVFNRHGALTEYRYDIPRDTWRLTLTARATALADAATASTSLQVRRRVAVGWIGLGPSYAAVVTRDGIQNGLGVTVSFNTTLWTR